MAQRKKLEEIPEPAIDGLLEVTIGGLYAGLHPTDATRHILATMQDHEQWILQKQNRRKNPDQDRVNTALHNLGRIAALNAFLDMPQPSKLGF